MKGFLVSSLGSKRFRSLFGASFISTLAVAAVLLGTGPAAPVVEAQGPPNQPPGLQVAQQRARGLFELAGVVFTDADETTGRLVVGVLDRGAEGLVRAKLTELGVPNQSVDVVETDAIFQLSTLRDQLSTLRDRADSVVGGLQIRFSGYLCSLGFNAIRGDVLGFVTASHCSDKQGQVDGTLFYQPVNQVDNEFIGTEIADPAYLRNVSGCPKGRKCRNSDANFSKGSGARFPFPLGLIAKTTGPNNGALDIAGYFTISGDGVASSGEVNKVGRTTGWTQAPVTRTCVDTGVSGTSIVLLCQTFVESNTQIVAGGDSGSPVFRIDGGTNVTLLGILWGGNNSGTLFIYSPIENIVKELGALITYQ